ncbi:uncharacterized protein LOC134832316 [Culicoides brevitarsis]|uniref:uncharacterized protein LOC134832316 n=1 Tax=Culicoides brevitarsis TaxID=469753 RepID=UPI00307B1B9E
MANVILNLNDLPVSKEKKDYFSMNESVLSLEMSKSLVDEVLALNRLDKPELNKRVQWISEQILRSTSYNVDAVDEETQKCVLHLLLDLFIRVGYKHESEFDIVENILFASKLDYETYENGQVLHLLMRYDIIKYFQWQIINEKEEDFYREFEEKSKEMQNKPKTLNDLLEVTLAFGSLNIFRFLVDFIHNRYVGPAFDCPILVKAAAWSIYVVDEKKPQFYECFDYLLNQHQTDVNAEDANGNTALHHACMNKEEYLIKALLNKKANIDVATLKKGIPTEIFASYLDSLVTAVPEDLSRSGLTKFGQARLQQKYVDDRIIFINLKSFVFCPITYIEVLNFISLHHDYRHLLHHPVLGALQDLTWQMMYWKRVILNTPTMLTRIMFLMFLFLPYTAKIPGMDVFVKVLVLGVVFGKIYLSIYLFEYYRGTHRVNKKFFNTVLLLKMINITAYLYFVFFIMEECTISECPETMACTFMYFAINITLSIGLFSPSVARYNFMLLKILINALKFLISISFLIFGFALAFVALFGKSFGEIPDAAPSEEEFNILSSRKNFAELVANETTTGEAHFQRFDFYAIAILKTLFTLSGELNDDTFRYRTFMSCLFLATFILVIPIMAVNLLTGLAVGDVYELISHSKFWHRKMQCLLTLSSMWQIEAPNKVKPAVRILDKFLVPFKLKDNLKRKLQDNPTVAVNIRSQRIFACKNLEKYNVEELGRLNRSSVIDAVQIIKDRIRDDKQ